MCYTVTAGKRKNSHVVRRQPLLIFKNVSVTKSSTHPGSSGPECLAPECAGGVHSPARAPGGDEFTRRRACCTALLGFLHPCEDLDSTPESCLLPLASAGTETRFHHRSCRTSMQDAPWHARPLTRACPGRSGRGWGVGGCLALRQHGVERPRVSGFAFLPVRSGKPSSRVRGSEL